MKYLFIIPLITHLLIGCYTFKPFSKMSDWDLQHEYLDVQYKLSEKQAKNYNSPTYNTKGYINSYSNVASYFLPNSSVYSTAILSSISAGEEVKLKDDIATLSKRLSELRYEMSRRGLYSP